MDVAAANTVAARALVAGLAAAGVEHACISPGSRSTPLTVAFAEQNAIRPWLHLDERSSAFFALGLARATGRPVAVVCTSGTAAANFFPAIAEANLSRIPLIVLTADRPPSLRERGAAQTIDQLRMYGSHVRLALDLPMPVGHVAEAAQARVYATRAVSAALGELPGPVHLNVPFDEPLIAPPGMHPAPEQAPVAAPADLVAVANPRRGQVERAASVLSRAKRPLIVAGPDIGLRPPCDAFIDDLSGTLGAPILADPLSHLRTSGPRSERVLDSYDAILRDPRSASLAPDAVLHFGATPTSKALNGMLAGLRGAPYVLVDLPGGFRDPNLVADTLVAGDPMLVATQLGDALESMPVATDPDWCRRWVSANARARAAMQERCACFDELFEGRIFTELQAALPGAFTIVASNSMPVRDLDSFVVTAPKPLVLVSNRGANGIDGVVSSAMGAAAGPLPVVLVIGDVALYHDMNGLWAAKRHGLDITIVLVNNNGGGIFNYLPQAAHPTLFEEWFATPTGLDFAQVAALYGARHTLARDWPAFRTALGTAIRGGFHIIEVPTDRARNAAMHRDAWAAAGAAAFETAEVLA